MQSLSTIGMYDAYAPVYDTIGQGYFGERMAAWALSYLAERGEQPARVLDLACGAGAASLAFAAAGCDVVGVDRAPAMLSIARGRARDAGYKISFVEGDIRNINNEREAMNDEPILDDSPSAFNLRRSSFDLVTCFCDSLNYLIDDDDLDMVFAGAIVALRPGGYLIFDVNTTAEYTSWDERDTVVYDGRDYLVYNRLNYDPATHLATGRIVWFVRETELWWRGEETHTQRAWGDDEVAGALARTGLTIVERINTSGIDRFGGQEPHTGEARRMIYVASKR